MHTTELKPQSSPSLCHPLSPAFPQELPPVAAPIASGDGAEECLLAAMLAADALDVPLAMLLAPTASRGRVSGLCQPDYVLDIPGGYGKIPVGPSYLSQQRDGEQMQPRRLVDYCGGVHSYPPQEHGRNES